MEKRTYKIYCAGPLFNPKEQEEMRQIASELEESDYSVFLPQRDGLEFAKLFPCFSERGISSREGQLILNMAIFSLDVSEIMDSDGLLLNMNGRVPDEGAMVEAGIAWSRNKVIIIFRSDTRSLIEGSCNPLVLGLSDFSLVSAYDEIASAFEAKFADIAEDALLERDRCFEAAVKSGKEIREYLAGKRPIGDIADLIIALFRERTWRVSEDLKSNYSQTNEQG